MNNITKIITGIYNIYKGYIYLPESLKFLINVTSHNINDIFEESERPIIFDNLRKLRQHHTKLKYIKDKILSDNIYKVRAINISDYRFIQIDDILKDDQYNMWIEHLRLHHPHYKVRNLFNLIANNMSSIVENFRTTNNVSFLDILTENIENVSLKVHPKFNSIFLVLLMIIIEEYKLCSGHYISILLRKYLLCKRNKKFAAYKLLQYYKLLEPLRHRIEVKSLREISPFIISNLRKTVDIHLNELIYKPITFSNIDRNYMSNRKKAVIELAKDKYVNVKDDQKLEDIESNEVLTDVAMLLKGITNLGLSLHSVGNNAIIDNSIVQHLRNEGINNVESEKIKDKEVQFNETDIQKILKDVGFTGSIFDDIDDFGDDDVILE